MSARSALSTGTGIRRWLRLFRLALFVVVAFVIWRIVPIWLWTIVWEHWRWSAAVAFLDFLLIAIPVVVISALIGVIVLGLVIGRTEAKARRMRLAGPWLLCVTCLLGVGVMEVVSCLWLGWLHRAPVLKAPPRTARSPESTTPGVAIEEPVAEGSAPPLRILILGESSARGEPYHPWLSVGQILAWQLGQVLEGRRIDVDMQAEPGVPLEYAHQKLGRIRYRPDVLVLFAGHNEYQSRYAWTRVIPYYDRGKQPRPPFVERVLRCSWLIELIYEARERNRV